MSQERLMKVLLAPHVSEKSAMAADRDGQYVFRVARDATKPEIRQAVELLFKVEVDSVRVCNQKGKSKRFGQMVGRRPGFRKAYVSLKPGFDIDFMGEE